MALSTTFHSINSPNSSPRSYPRREAGDVWCLPPVWNLRAVIWFHFAISSPVLLPSPVTLSVLSFSARWSILLNCFQKILRYFSLRDRLFLYGSCLAARRSKLVGGMCSMLPYGTGICCYTFLYFLFFYCCDSLVFRHIFFNIYYWLPDTATVSILVY